MKQYIEDRIKEEANFIIDTKSTLRAAAKKFGVSKSTVHKDMVERLQHVVSFGIYLDVQSVICENKLERTKRGEEATRRKYANSN